MRTNLGNHQIWGRICPESWGLIWGFTKFGDEFVPKFEDKFGDSPILGTNLSLKLGKNLVFSQNLGEIWENCNSDLENDPGTKRKRRRRDGHFLGVYEQYGKDRKAK